MINRINKITLARSEILLFSEGTVIIQVKNLVQLIF